MGEDCPEGEGTLNMDLEARQLAKQHLERAQRGETESYGLLQAAQKANVEFAQNQSSTTHARRAVLARRAYETRITAELGRVMGAYALMAEREGTKAITAKQAMAKVRTAQQREVLVEQVKGAELRRGIMLQAMKAAEKAFDAAPGLPESVVGSGLMAGPAQATVGLTENFRPPSYISRAGAFFPTDVRAAAGSLKGVSLGDDWMQQVQTAIETDSAAVVKRAHELAAEVAGQEPGAAAVAQEAQNISTVLKARYATEAAGAGGFPWLHVVGGGAVLYILWKVLR